MKLLFSFFSLLLLLVACTPVDKPLQAVIDQTDQVKIIMYAPADTTIRRTTDEKEIAIFTELLKEKDDNTVAGSSIGEMIYFTKGIKRLSANLLRDGIRFNLDGKIYSRRFTYRAGMYLDDMK